MHCCSSNAANLARPEFLIRLDVDDFLQDEAAELVAAEGHSTRAKPEEALAYLSQHCELAVVTLGDQGCIAQKQEQAGMVQEPACSGVTVIDATGSSSTHSCFVPRPMSCHSVEE